MNGALNELEIQVEAIQLATLSWSNTIGTLMAFITKEQEKDEPVFDSDRFLIMTSVSSSNAGFRRFLSSSKK